MGQIALISLIDVSELYGGVTEGEYAMGSHTQHPGTSSEKGWMIGTIVHKKEREVVIKDRWGVKEAFPYFVTLPKDLAQQIEKEDDASLLLNPELQK